MPSVFRAYPSWSFWTAFGIVFGILFPWSAAGAQPDYIQYHKEILKCEQRFLYDDHIPKALEEYRAVFERYPKPFAKDCFIAVQLACFIGDKAGAEYFFHRAFQRGVCWYAMMRAPSVKKILDADRVYKDRIELLYKQEYPLFCRTINYRLRDTLIRMKRLDDSLKSLITGTKGEELQKREKRHRDAIEANTRKLMELTDRHGFLGDNVVGLMDNTIPGLERYYDDPRYIYGLRSLVDQLYYHHSCCYFMAPGRLQEALRNGEILPAMYASIYEWAYLDLKEKRPELTLCGPVGEQCEHYNICPVLPDSEKSKNIAEVNRYRLAIGLAPVDHYERRKKFQKETGVRLLYGMFDIY